MFYCQRDAALWLLTCISFSIALHADCFSHTVFVPRSITCDASYELALTNYDFYHTPSEHGFDLYLTPFYQRSFHGKNLAPYFLLHGKECITFAQDGSGDVDPLWLDLVGGDHKDYRSTIFAKPQRTVYGMHVALFMDFTRYIEGLWAAIAFSPIGAQHLLQLREEVIEGAPGLIPGIQSGLQALNNPDLKFGKFTTCKMHKAGVDDIQIKCGWNRFCDDGEQHQGVYGVITLPTAGKPHNNFIFEPRIGTRNVSLGFGTNIDATVWERPMCGTFHFMLDLKYRYLFQAKECRSFDLCQNGEWSRFLQIVNADQRSNPTPGINTAFTQEVSVTPRSQIEWWNAFHWTRRNVHVEIGWNFWYRQAEKVRPALCHFGSAGIYDLGADAQRQNARHQQVREPISASHATISQSVFEPNAVPSDALFTSIGALNASSGSHPRALSNTIYVASAYDKVLCNMPTFFGAGLSVELGNDHSAFDFWSAWAKCGMHF